MAPCMSEVAGPAIIAAAVWELRNMHLHGSHNLAGSWQMSTCTHIVYGLHCLRHFKYKLRFLAFLGRLKAVAILGPYSCSEDLEPSMSGRAVLSSSRKFPAGVCQPPLYSWNLSRHWTLWSLGLPRKNKTQRHEILNLHGGNWRCSAVW